MPKETKTRASLKEERRTKVHAEVATAFVELMKALKEHDHDAFVDHWDPFVMPLGQHYDDGALVPAVMDFFNQGFRPTGKGTNLYFWHEAPDVVIHCEIRASVTRPDGKIEEGNWGYVEFLVNNEKGEWKGVRYMLWRMKSDESDTISRSPHAPHPVIW
jgi:hypothetical protein